MSGERGKPRGGATRRRARSGRSALAHERAVVVVLSLVVVGSVLAIGTVHTPVLVVVAVVAVANALHAAHLARSTGEVAIPTASVLLLALAGFTVLQAVPLPVSWIARLSPEAAHTWSRALSPLGEPGPGWASLSLDPGASWVEALKWLTYACVVFTAGFVSDRRGAAAPISIVFASGLVNALITISHGLLGATRVFGLYQPRFGAAPWHVGPLLNPNNMAGYSNLAVFCGIGLVLMQREVLPRWLVALGQAAIVAVAGVTASRGGVVALLLGALFLLAILGFNRAPGRAGARIPPLAKALVPAGLLGGGALAFLGSTAETWRELYDKSAQKLSMLAWAKPMIDEHRWFGIGRGAFESTFPAYRTTSGNVVFTHIESFPAQWISEWGVPVGLAALLALAWGLRPDALGVKKSALAASAWVGVLVLLLQNLVDLGLEVPAISIALAVVYGALAGDPGRHEAGLEQGMRFRVDRAWPPLAMATAALVLTAIVARTSGRDVASERDALHQSILNVGGASPTERAAIRAHIRAAMLAHPAEPYFPLVGALLARVNREDPLPWVARSLERAVLNGPAHLVLAEALAGRGRAPQALLELRLAVQDDAELTDVAAADAARWTVEESELLRAVPAGPRGAAMLHAIARRLRREDQAALRLRLLREALTRSPDDDRVQEDIAYDLLAELRDSRSGECDSGLRDPCMNEIARTARALEERDAASSRGARLRAAVLALEGKHEEAERLLSGRCSDVSDRLQCLRARMVTATELKGANPFAACAKELLAAACGDPSACADTASWVGDLHAGRGEHASALSSYVRAASEDPTEARLRKLAEAAAGMGANVVAIEALERLQRLRGPDPAVKATIDELRTRILGNLGGR